MDGNGRISRKAIVAIAAICPVFALSWGCSGNGKVLKVTMDGKQARLLLCLSLPPSVTRESWQEDMYMEISEEAERNGFIAVRSQSPVCRGSGDPEEEQGNRPSLDEKKKAAEVLSAQLVMTRTWMRTPNGCSYSVKVVDIASGSTLVDESGEARRGCTDRGLARPTTVAAKMALQQAAYMLRRREELKSSPASAGTAVKMQREPGEFQASVHELARSLEVCGCEQGSAHEVEFAVELSIEVDSSGKIQIWTDAGPGVPDQVVSCIEAKARSWTYPLPYGDDTFSSTLMLRLKGRPRGH